MEEEISINNKIYEIAKSYIEGTSTLADILGHEIWDNHITVTNFLSLFESSELHKGIVAIRKVLCFLDCNDTLMKF